MKSLDSMTPDELCVEASKIRKQIVDSAERLNQVCEVMYSLVRKMPSDLTSTYINISNVTRRFAGAVVQGSKRTDAVNRALTSKRASIRMDREREERKAEVQRRKEAREIRQVITSAQSGYYGIFDSSNKEAVIEQLTSKGDMSSDLNDLYGEE
jgi:hypothetical protein